MVHETKQKTATKQAEPEPVVEAKDLRSGVTDALDDLLDEIDNVLEENAEEFVMNYVQHGGQ